MSGSLHPLQSRIGRFPLASAAESPVRSSELLCARFGRNDCPRYRFPAEAMSILRARRGRPGRAPVQYRIELRMPQSLMLDREALRIRARRGQILRQCSVDSLGLHPNAFFFIPVPASLAQFCERDMDPCDYIGTIAIP